MADLAQAVRKDLLSAANLYLLLATLCSVQPRLRPAKHMVRARAAGLRRPATGLRQSAFGSSGCDPALPAPPDRRLHRRAPRVANHEATSKRASPSPLPVDREPSTCG